ncbi:MAG: hypothetical protein ACRD4U_12320 [Candidatus Acidiferrales bacterium]
MKLVLLIVLAVVALLVAAAGYLWYRVRRLAESQETQELLGTFDTGLAIPMRDCDTRRTPAEKKPAP